MRKDRAYRKGRIMRFAQNAIDDGVLYVSLGVLTQREVRDFRKDFPSLNGYLYYPPRVIGGVFIGAL